MRRSRLNLTLGQTGHFPKLAKCLLMKKPIIPQSENLKNYFVATNSRITNMVSNLFAFLTNIHTHTHTHTHTYSLFFVFFFLTSTDLDFFAFGLFVLFLYVVSLYLHYRRFLFHSYDDKPLLLSLSFSFLA